VVPELLHRHGFSRIRIAAMAFASALQNGNGSRLFVVCDFLIFSGTDNPYFRPSASF